MNVTEIDSLCSALSIGEQERPATILDVSLKDRGELRLALCLVGKVLASKVVNRVAFRDVLQRIWRVNGGVEIVAIKDNIFEFQFTNLEARKRILSGGPWRFDGAIIVFEEPVGSGDIATMEFNKTEIWVQIHNLPMLCLTEEIAIFLGNMIGEVRKVDLEAGKSGTCRFIRARVVIKVDEPLRRSLRVDLLGNGKVTTMLVRYERVPDFCYKCNRLGHTLGECPVPGDNREATCEANLRLCTWMRTTSPPKQHSYGHGNGRMDQGRRDWYGSSGQREVRRSQDNWRQPETDGGRRGIFREVGEKVNLGTPASKVACEELNGSIYDTDRNYVHGKSKCGECQASGSEPAQERAVLESIEETGGVGGGPADYLITDQSMGVEGELGQQVNLSPLVDTAVSQRVSPSISCGVEQMQDIGPHKLDQTDSREPPITTKALPTWKRVGRGPKGDQAHLSVGVKLGKRVSLISGEESLVASKRFKESSLVDVQSPEQHTSGDDLALVEVERDEAAQGAMDTRSRCITAVSTVETESQISAGRSLPTSRTQ
ncbi:hypothetical protein Q3G72_024255 [Acer saccharum]|nr:hypothetical protein Q3G72_024255 [Acer saccharum]